MRNRVCDLMSIEFPILAFTHCRDVVAAVTNAGGLGVLGGSSHTPEQLDIDLAWICEQVKGQPFGVDLVVPARYVGKEQGGATRAELTAQIPQEHRDFVDDIMRRYDVPPLPADDPRLAEWANEISPVMSLHQAVPLMEIAFAYPIALMVNALGTPPQDMVQLARSHDVTLGALAGKAAHAVRHVAAGVDLVIAQGYEAGGHTGEIGSMVLIPEIVDAVAPIPVLAAGGIGGGRQMAAALALGADGVWCGSIWLATEEAETHPLVKQKFLAATSSDTLRSRSRTGKPARQLRSAWTDEWDSSQSPGPLPMPLQPILSDEALARIDHAAHLHDSGAGKLANYFVGQIVGSMDAVLPARRVVLDMVDEFIDTITQLNEIVT